MILATFFDWISNPNTIFALLTLTFLEVVLGVDNMIFVSIAADKLPNNLRQKARTIGLVLAMLTRILLLSLMFILVHLDTKLFNVGDFTLSASDVVLFLGGLFLVYKAFLEILSIYKNVHHSETFNPPAKGASKTCKISAQFWLIILQIGILDIVFSLDSVITAVGMVEDLAVMIIAIMCAILIMIFLTNRISKFIEKHIDFKILAISFLGIVGIVLIGDALHFEIERSYLYVAIIFSLFVECIQLLIKNKKEKLL